MSLVEIFNVNVEISVGLWRENYIVNVKLTSSAASFFYIFTGTGNVIFFHTRSSYHCLDSSGAFRTGITLLIILLLETSLRTASTFFVNLLFGNRLARSIVPGVTDITISVPSL